VRDNTIARFYKNFVVFVDQTKIACYPPAYDHRVWPRYRIADVSCSKVNTSFCLYILGIVLTILGFALFVFGMQQNSDSGDDETPLYIGLAGLVMLLIGIYLLVRPLLNQSYNVTFKMLSNKVEVGETGPGYCCGGGCCCGCCGGEPEVKNSFTLFTYTEPDQDFLMKFAYGAMGESMSGYHSLAHLVEDNLFSKVRPNDIRATGMFSQVAGE